MYIQIFVVNLIRSVNRRRNITLQLEKAGLKFEIFPATDGGHLSRSDMEMYSESESIATAGRPLLSGEIACALSHARVWQCILDRKIDIALILEDDAILNDRLGMFLKQIDKLPTDWDIVNLRSDGQFDRLNTEIIENVWLTRFTAKMNRTAAYLIKRNAAEKALSKIYPIRRAVDGLLAMMRKSGELVAYGTVPELVSHNEIAMPSTIRGAICPGKSEFVPDRKIGVAVTTYSHDKTHPGRYQLIRQTLDTLLETTAKITESYISRIIVVDGPVPDTHRALLSEYSQDILIIYRSENGGAARAKNTCIRTMLEQGVEIGFLLDDDLKLRDGWLERYYDLMVELDAHHVAGFASRHFFPQGPKWRELNMRYENIGNYRVLKHRGAHGHLLTFTPSLIKKIGYFKVFPGKMGGWHANFTYRAVRAGIGKFHWAVDLADGERYVEHMGQDEIWNWGAKNHLASVSRHLRNREWHKNKDQEFYTNPDEYVPCIE